MTLPPLERFLGVDEQADDRTVLGLGPGPLSAAQVKDALRRRLEDVDDHPAADGPDARVVRERLRTAAVHLARLGDAPSPRAAKAEAKPAATTTGAAAPPVRPGSPEATLRPQRPRPSAGETTRAAPGPAARPGPAPERPRIRLTPFDQQVLAVLVGSRGWNAKARSKLVAMAASHGVSVQGLVKVVNGLSEYAKSGGPRLGVSEITAGRVRMAEPPGLPAAAPRPPSSALMRTIAEQLDAERPGVRLRMAAITALVTILAGILTVWLVVPRESARRAAPPERPARAGTGAVPAQPGRPQAESPSAPVFTARYTRMPTFVGNALPQEAAEAADAAPQTIEDLDRLARQLNVDPSLSIRDRRDWQRALRTAGTGWFILDRSTRAEITQLILDAVYIAADEPAVSDELLSELAPAEPGADPLDLWRGAWQVGTLAVIASNQTLPPVVVQQARRQLEETIGERLDDDEVTFAAIADRWLRTATEQLVSITGFDDRIEDRWELWIAAQRELGAGERFDGAMLDVLEAVLSGGTDLARPGPSANLVGRMLLLIGFTDSPAVRRRVVSWFDEPAITVSDLWVLTSLMSLHDRTPWFGNDLVLPIDADPAMRRRVADLIARRWEAAAGPSPAAAAPEGRGVVVDGPTLRMWRETRGRLEAGLASRGHGLRELAVAARLNAAAAMLEAGRVVDARWQLQEAESLLVADPRSLVVPLQPGQAIGTDGAWSRHYDEAGRNLEQRLTRLRSLRSSAGTDLGPADAARLVAEAYRGTPSDVRSLAQAVIVEYFSRGPNVALELVNQLPDTSPNDWLSELISQLTGRSLPSIRSASWPLEARRALTDHALALRPLTGPPTDALVQIVGAAYDVRLERFGRPMPQMGGSGRPAHESAEELALHWQRSVSAVMARVEVPSDLVTLQRRHLILRRLARGPIQSFVAAQLSILELLAYVAVAEQPARAQEVAELLRASQEVRDGMAHVVEQAVEAERAAASIWEVRLVSEDELGERRRS